MHAVDVDFDFDFGNWSHTSCMKARYKLTLNRGELTVNETPNGPWLVEGEVFLKASGVDASLYGWVSLTEEAALCARQEGEYVVVSLEMREAPGGDLESVVSNAVGLAIGLLEEKADEVEPPDGWEVARYEKRESVYFYEEWCSGSVFAIDDNGCLRGEFDRMCLSLAIEDWQLLEKVRECRGLVYFIVSVEAGGVAHEVHLVPPILGKSHNDFLVGNEGGALEAMIGEAGGGHYPEVVYEAAFALLEKCRDSLTRGFQNNTLRAYTHEDPDNLRKAYLKRLGYFNTCHRFGKFYEG